MARRSGASLLHLFMNGYRVGYLSRLPGGSLRFAYHADWLSQPGARPISLSLPLARTTYQGTRVYNFFDNLLPDNPEIRARIQRRFQCPTAQPFDLLAAIGADCVGAIQLTPEDAPKDVRRVRATRLSPKKIAALLRDYQDAPLGMSRMEDEFRISIAGAQEKTSFLRFRGAWHLPHGPTPASHILKLPIGVLRSRGIDLNDSCENEWLCLKIIRAFGLPAAEAEIHFFEEMKTLVVTRFDRKWAPGRSWLMRLPQEDMCQALGNSPGLKYESDGGPGMKAVMDLLLGSRSAGMDREVFFKSQILFFLLAAIDGHAKNFSIRLLPESVFDLAPLYDIVSAHPLIARRQLALEKAALAMALHGSRKYYRLRQVRPRHWLSTAHAVRYSPESAGRNIEEILGAVDSVIDTVAAGLPSDFPASVADPIFTGMKTMRDKFGRFSDP